MRAKHVIESVISSEMRGATAQLQSARLAELRRQLLHQPNVIAMLFDHRTGDLVSYRVERAPWGHRLILAQAGKADRTLVTAQSSMALARRAADDGQRWLRLGYEEV